MSDLDISTNHRMVMVRDPDGCPFRLYPKRALPKLLPSLLILSRLRQSESRERDAVEEASKGSTQTAVRKPGRVEGGRQVNREGTSRTIPPRLSEPVEKARAVQGNQASVKKGIPDLMESHESYCAAEQKVHYVLVLTGRTDENGGQRKVVPEGSPWRPWSRGGTRDLCHSCS